MMPHGDIIRQFKSNILDTCSVRLRRQTCGRDIIGPRLRTKRLFCAPRRRHKFSTRCLTHTRCGLKLSVISAQRGFCATNSEKKCRSAFLLTLKHTIKPKTKSDWRPPVAYHHHHRA